jgi:hypothetical protein
MIFLFFGTFLNHPFLESHNIRVYFYLDDKARDHLDETESLLVLYCTVLVQCSTTGSTVLVLYCAELTGDWADQ